MLVGVTEKDRLNKFCTELFIVQVNYEEAMAPIQSIVRPKATTNRLGCSRCLWCRWMVVVVEQDPGICRVFPKFMPRFIVSRNVNLLWNLLYCGTAFNSSYYTPGQDSPTVFTVRRRVPSLDSSSVATLLRPCPLPV